MNDPSDNSAGLSEPASSLLPPLLLQAILDAIPVPAFFKDRQGRFAGCNAIFEELVGRRRDALLGKTAAGLLPPEREAEFLEEERTLLAEGGSSRYEGPLLRVDGTRREVVCTKAALRAAGGEISGLVGTVFDLTERARMVETLRESDERFRSIFEHAGVGMNTVSPEGRYIEVNPAFCRFLGYSPEEFEGLTVEDVTHPDDREMTRLLFAEVRDGRRRLMEYEKRFLRKDGTEVWGAVTSAWLFGAAGTPLYAVGLVQDITERKRAEEKLRENERRLHYLAHHDALTHLPNRLLLQDRLQHAMAKVRRSGKEMALLFLDLDQFKKVNDSLGHETGDRLLCEVAARLRQCVREADTLARFGGDEFVILIEQMDQPEQATVVAQKALAVMAEVFGINGHRVYLTTSIGISLFPADAADAEGLLKCAEAAMYRSKEEDRNRYRFYKPEMNARAYERLLLEGSLRQALEQEELTLVYQPQVELATGRCTGVEALLRWRHPVHGMIAPSDFISLAEETGLIVPMGEWVLHTACLQGRRWQDALGNDLRIAVNISARQFRQPELVRSVARALESSGLDPWRLELELTESMIMHDIEKAIFTMGELSRMGVQLAIDDFGSGYSSLAYLKQFPISRLKIDQSFVRDIDKNRRDAALTAAIIRLARSLGLQAVAEGVETAAQRDFLRRNGCDYGQGYLFSYPLPDTEIPSCLATLEAGSSH